MAHDTHGYSAQEWAVRCELAALYRLVAHFRMTDMIDTHITVRVPGPEHHFLINRYGVLFHEMCASDLVKIDSAGRVVEADADAHPERYRVNAAGFTIHSAVHMARPDLACVIHTHTSAGSAVSAQRQGLLPISQHALKFYEHLAYHDYEGIALRDEEKPRLVADLGTNVHLILKNHGLLTVGATVAEAFTRMYYLEASCAIQVRAQAGGGELTHVSKEVLDASYATMQGGGAPRRSAAALVWPGLLRRLDRTDPSYRS